MLAITASGPANLDDFAPIKWAAPLFSSPEWRITNRSRNSEPDEDSDRFCRNTLRAFDGVQNWIEMYKAPTPGSSDTTHTILLCKFGAALNGFPGICHGGAVMSLMDEALALPMFANEVKGTGQFVDPAVTQWLAEGRSLTEVLNGLWVTARLDMQFLKPVTCPGVVGIEVEVLEKKGHKMKMRGTMKDGKGTPLLKADGVWVRVGGAPKEKL
ncbi:hypothetical protein K491DRAFT_693045 [Lophiostoma macrostomum CBS 122681]|uniref:Thioesterase domain-containing protein n=1 Tax=Lophiostoma macrostomum CBS 122681 TaxID=1314788 RepID=A0A6A6T5G7_9PLEO|nr:hypothetical protein K491DRAFT_693045 [Lophiostoma macrostomum CBS 122681]